jgi:membrane-associated protein
MTIERILAWVAEHDEWAYLLMAAYAVAKTGPLPLIAGFLAAGGALRLEWVLGIVLGGSLLGAQIRFWVGRLFSPWLYRRGGRVANWIALSSATVERYSAWMLPAYRFVKGAFSLVGVGAGASLLNAWRFALLDALGAVLWTCVMIGIGYGLGQLNIHFDPRWSAYLGLGLLAAAIIGFSVLGKTIFRLIDARAQQTVHERCLSKRAAHNDLATTPP